MSLSNKVFFLEADYVQEDIFRLLPFGHLKFRSFSIWFGLVLFNLFYLIWFGLFQEELNTQTQEQVRTLSAEIDRLNHRNSVLESEIQTSR